MPYSTVGQSEINQSPIDQSSSVDSTQPYALGESNGELLEAAYLGYEMFNNGTPPQANAVENSSAGVFGWASFYSSTPAGKRFAGVVHEAMKLDAMKHEAQTKKKVSEARHKALCEALDNASRGDSPHVAVRVAVSVALLQSSPQEVSNALRETSKVLHDAHKVLHEARKAHMTSFGAIYSQ